jgi:hypothetical protein
MIIPWCEGTTDVEFKKYLLLSVVLACAPYSFPGFGDSQWRSIFSLCATFPAFGDSHKI